ncbi:MAG: hypothetical protein AB7K04_17245 [Pseudorhodoplanes sp.]
MFRSYCNAVGVLALLAFCTPSAGAQESGIAASGRSRDIATFRHGFMDRDRAFTPAARREAERRLAALEASSELTDAGFEIALARIVALADNGHSSLVPGPRSARQRRVGLRLMPFGQHFYVVRAQTANADLLGARLIAIDGRPISRVRDVARGLFGGIAAFRDRGLSVIFESPAVLAELGLANSPTAGSYRFRTVNGQVTERHLEAAEGAVGSASRTAVRRNFYPELRTEEAGGWVAALASNAAPWSLQAPDEPFRWRDGPEIDGMVVEFRQNLNAANRRIADFLAEIEAEIMTRRPRNLVVDMRMNGGGDLTTTRDFMQRLPGLVTGRIFVVTSSWTFSAAISSIGYLEQAAPDRVTIVGEPVGDRLMFFAEGGPIALPDSGIRLIAATERHDYRHGCRGRSDCHRWVVQHPIAIPSLQPDISAPWTIGDYLAGRDPGIAAVVAAIRGRERTAN